jgi:hypothetical protein
MRILLGLLLLTSCAGPPQARHERPKGWAGHQAEAEQHDRAARIHDQAAAEATASSSSIDSYQCGDTVLNEQSTSGTEPITTWTPCWNLDEEAAIRHRQAADAERRAAREDRAQATALARAEIAHCRGIPQHELTHSPFDHKRAIEEVIPHRSGGVVRGVRIVFKPVAGLTADYMRRAIACNQARFSVLGNPAQFAPEDPTLVEGAEVEVTNTRSNIIVTIRVPDDVQAAVALERAKDLVRARTAVR